MADWKERAAEQCAMSVAKYLAWLASAGDVAYDEKEHGRADRRQFLEIITEESDAEFKRLQNQVKAMRPIVEKIADWPTEGVDTFNNYVLVSEKQWEMTLNDVRQARAALEKIKEIERERKP